MIIVESKSGEMYSGKCPHDVIEHMQSQSWGIPTSIVKYKELVQTRVASISNTTFLYWDATSFLLGLKEIGFLQIIEWGVIID